MVSVSVDKFSCLLGSISIKWYQSTFNYYAEETVLAEVAGN